MFGYKEDKEVKKEAFRKYLESTGVLDGLTKVLVALYEQNDKPLSALEFIQQKLGGPSSSDYEKLQSEMSDLQIKYSQLLASHQQVCKEDIEISESLEIDFVKQMLFKLEEVKQARDVTPPFFHENEVEHEKERL